MTDRLHCILQEREARTPVDSVGSSMRLGSRPAVGGLEANGWLSAQRKTGVAYGNAELDRNGLSGKTKKLLCRVQWVY